MIWRSVLGVYLIVVGVSGLGIFASPPNLVALVALIAGIAALIGK